MFVFLVRFAVWLASFLSGFMLLLGLSLPVEGKGRGDRNPSAIPDDIYDAMTKLTKGKVLPSVKEAGRKISICPILEIKRVNIIAKGKWKSSPILERSPNLAKLGNFRGGISPYERTWCKKVRVFPERKLCWTQPK